MENPELEYKLDQSHGHRDFWRRILADALADKYPRFNRQRWLDYIQGRESEQKSTPCLLCGQPVTWAMWRKFTPCPKSKSGQSGHALACTPESLGIIAPKK